MNVLGVGDRARRIVREERVDERQELAASCSAADPDDGDGWNRSEIADVCCTDVVDEDCQTSFVRHLHKKSVLLRDDLRRPEQTGSLPVVVEGTGHATDDNGEHVLPLVRRLLLPRCRVHLRSHGDSPTILTQRTTRTPRQPPLLAGLSAAQ